MEEQVLIQFRADKNLREDCVRIYDALGIDLNTALRLFMEKTRAVSGFPFPAMSSEKKITHTEALAAFQELREQARDVPEMSLDEINAEINAVRTKKRERQCHAMQ